jgi:very-short-patch-repair endonuclease
MRHALSKLRRNNSTKTERKIAEILKANHIKFKAKWMVEGRECDFVIGRVIIEVDGDIHSQIDREREQKLLDAGYIPLHISVRQVYESNELEKDIIHLIKTNNYD